MATPALTHDSVRLMKTVTNASPAPLEPAMSGALDVIANSLLVHADPRDRQLLVSLIRTGAGTGEHSRTPPSLSSWLARVGGAPAESLAWNVHNIRVDAALSTDIIRALQGAAAVLSARRSASLSTHVL